jgi:Flp pilus assembly protein TadG
MAPRQRIRRLSDSRGTNLVEAAIVTPLLLLLTFAIVDFSSLFYVHLALENGVSQATRFGVTGKTLPNPGGGTMSRTDSVKTAMRNATPTLTIGDAAFAFAHIPAGGAAWVGGTGGPGEIERVTVTYNWRPFTPLIRPFFPGGEITLQVASTMKNEGKFE